MKNDIKFQGNLPSCVRGQQSLERLSYLDVYKPQ